MTCRTCGARCHGRFCKPCGRDFHRDQGITNESDDEDSTDVLRYECCNCHKQYQNEGPGQCPHCGNWGARYAGEVESESEPMTTDGGRSLDDYVDLDEQIVGDGGQEVDDSDDSEESDVRFDHIQRVDGSRYLRIHTEKVDYLVQVHGDDLDELRDRLDEPPTAL